jgi:hypothetical protein
MIVDDLRTVEHGATVERSARVRWRGGEERLTVTVPAAYASDPADASPFLPAALLPAMRRGEPLEVDGAVSERLLHGLVRAQGAYAAWTPDARPCVVHAAQVTTDAGAAGRAHATLFSRGVDSLFAAVGAEPDLPEIDALVFSPTLHGTFFGDVRDREVALSTEAAERLGAELVVVNTNVRAFVEQTVAYDDAQGAALATLALATAGGICRVLVPGTHSHHNLKPWGSHPLLDPWFSTEAVEVLHGTLDATRYAKLARVVAERPDLLPWLKVCFAENRPDNCGRCPKCLETMAYLQALDVLPRATGFPGTLDLDALSRIEVSPAERMSIAEAVRAIDPVAHAPVRTALVTMLRRGARPAVRARVGAALAVLRGTRDDPDPRVRTTTSALKNVHTNRTIGALITGRIYPPAQQRTDVAAAGSFAVGPLPEPPSTPATAVSSVGLVRVLDYTATRHVYGAGAIPPPLHAATGDEAERRVLVGELGALHPADPGDGVPLWLTADGRTTAVHPGPSVRFGRALRWAAAPARWRERRRPERALAVIWRLGALPRYLAASQDNEPPSGPPAGWLESTPRDGLRPLHLALHPVTGDQLLVTEPREATDLGYGEPVLLGHLLAEAPVTGHLGVMRPRIPWASRFGL